MARKKTCWNGHLFLSYPFISVCSERSTDLSHFFLLLTEMIVIWTSPTHFLALQLPFLSVSRHIKGLIFVLNQLLVLLNSSTLFPPLKHIWFRCTHELKQTLYMYLEIKRRKKFIFMSIKMSIPFLAISSFLIFLSDPSIFTVLKRWRNRRLWRLAV